MARPMELDLSGRVVLVTGASRGIGLAVARALVAEGARVAICSRDEAAIAAAAAQLGDQATGLAADVRDDAAVAAFVAHAAAHARWGRAEEIADVVVFLLSHAARFVNGTVLRADGGQAPGVDY
jgi:NAD(P)-dependent dehydrogenase (short-subunit alcohol dehydrogenase family)